MKMKSLVCSLQHHPTKLTFATLLLFSVAASSQDRGQLVYDIVVAVSNYSDVDHAHDAERVNVHLNTPPFYWDAGSIHENDKARLSDDQPRTVPESLLLSWEEDGEPFHAPFTIKMPPPLLLESIRNSEAKVNGQVVRNRLELFLEIRSDLNSARAYWRENKVQSISLPETQSSARASGVSKE